MHGKGQSYPGKWRLININKNHPGLQPSNVLKDIAICKKDICTKVYENPTANAKVVYIEASDRIRDQLDDASRQE